MIRWVRRATVNGVNRLPQALEWSKDITAYINEKHNLGTSCWVQQFGHVGVLVWEANHADMAAMEAAMATIVADPQYWQKIAEAEGLFLAGKTTDAVFQQIA